MRYVLSDLFQGDYRISQYFGANKAYYQQYGLLGHEGVDWWTPVGVRVLAPFNGIIVRDVDNPKINNYGGHMVVWDPVQRCAVWYCHLSVNYIFTGQSVKKGQVLGLTGNTGNVLPKPTPTNPNAGAHFHVNFCETDAYANRLNTKNGYWGFRNILNSALVQWQLGGL